ncbi:M6 family metalloprotease domain-containing protein [bacterium]
MKKIFIYFLFLILLTYSAFACLAPPNPEVYDVSGADHISLKDKTKRAPKIPVPRMPRYTIKSPQYVASSGSAMPLVILIEFDGTTHSATHDRAYMNNLVFDGHTRPSDSKTISVKNYFNEISGGKLVIENPSVGSNPTAWLTSAHTMSYYGADTNTSEGLIDDANGAISELAREAVQLLDDGIFDFSKFDLDGDKIIDRVIVVHAGQGQEASINSNTIWSHHWEISGGEEVKDEYTVKEYSIVSEYSPLGIFVHEFAHGFRSPDALTGAGIPDLYNTSSGESAVGTWCLMDSGSWLDSGWNPAHLSAWCKCFLEWGTMTTLTESNLNALLYPTSEADNSSATNEFYKIPILNSDDEYFLLEYRRKTGGTNIYDTALKAEGLLIWHIDNSVLDETITYDDYGTQSRLFYNEINTDDSHKGIDVVEADNSESSGNEDGDIFGLSVTQFVHPQSSSHSGNNSGISIVNIAGPSANYMSMDIYVIKATENQRIAKSYNYPNPASASTNIKIKLTKYLSKGKLSIFNIAGEMVFETDVNNSNLTSSSDYEWIYEVTWDCDNNEGMNAASGVYIYIFNADDLKAFGKIIVLR